MSQNSEIRIPETRKKSEIRKRKSAAPFGKQSVKSEDAGIENFGLQSSDFFRISDFEPRISAESTSLKQFNSEF